jgi:hypothetical protein
MWKVAGWLAPLIPLGIAVWQKGQQWLQNNPQLFNFGFKMQPVQAWAGANFNGLQNFVQNWFNPPQLNFAGAGGNGNVVGDNILRVQPPENQLGPINPRPPVMQAAEARNRLPQIGPRWQPREITNPRFASGCEDVARQIQGHIGGDIRRITPPAQGGFVGPYRGQNLDWHEHIVVVKDGRVYDAFTGHNGLPIDEYKALWAWRADINFGF